MSKKKKGIVILARPALDRIYGERLLQDIAQRIDLVAPPQTSESIQDRLDLLADVEVIFTGWGAPRMDARFLDHAPHLQAVFHGAGSVRRFITPDFWERDILLTTARAVNAKPVAEFTLGTILLSLKRTWYYALEARRLGQFPPKVAVPGAYESTVGIVSFGLVGQHLRDLLRSFDINVLLYDPFVTQETAHQQNITLASLNDVFRQSDVVTLHTPSLPETQHMIRARHFELMKNGATFINTARGAVVHEEEMILSLRRRTDISAFLDVTQTEPPVLGSPLYTMPNIVLTPHIAGSLNQECLRMGEEMIKEFDRWINNKEVHGALTKKSLVMQA